MKVGILGFAHGHVGMYCNRWKQESDLDIQVTTGWDRDAERLAAKADELGIAPADSADALLASDIDAVVIGSETSLHADLVVKAAAAGKAIVLQKPISTTLEDANRIVEAVNCHGVAFSMAWQMRVDPQNLEMKGLIESGVLGRLFQMRRRHGLTFCRNPASVSSWHLDPEYNRDIFADDAAHAVDFLYWLFGAPQTVTAELGTLMNPAVPNDHAICIFRYPDGMMVEVVNAFRCLVSENTTEIIAEKGTVIQNYGDQPSAGAPRPEGTPSLKWMLEGDTDWTVSADPGVRSQSERIAHLAGPLADFLHGERPPIAAAEEGRDVLRIIHACYEANEKGCRTPIKL
jgi:predicted dehydrogenase